MRSWIISCLLFAALIGLVIGNAYYVRRVATHISQTAEELCMEHPETGVRLDALEHYWENHRRYMALSIAYHELDHLGESLIALCAAYDAQNASDFELYRQLTADAAAELARLEHFSVENLLSRSKTIDKYRQTPL